MLWSFGRIPQPVGAGHAMQQSNMKAIKTDLRARRHEALVALQHAVVEGATWRYEHLVETAQGLGVTDHQLDAAIHEALQSLFDRAEQTVTVRQLDAMLASDRLV